MKADDMHSHEVVQTPVAVSRHAVGRHVCDGTRGHVVKFPLTQANFCTVFRLKVKLEVSWAHTMHP